MSKAACPSSKLTRRAAIAATLAAASPALPAPRWPDPAYAAIGGHNAAYAAFESACHHVARMESVIPKDKRREWFDEDRAKGIGTDDDPRWTAALNANRAASATEKQVAWTLTRVRPASLAGMAALLRHAADVTARGDEWPCDPDDASDEDGEEWIVTFHSNLAAALEAMA
jgi:hypothetical protein